MSSEFSFVFRVGGSRCRVLNLHVVGSTFLKPHSWQTLLTLKRVVRHDRRDGIIAHFKWALTWVA